MRPLLRVFSIFVLLEALVACAPKPVKEEEPAPDANWIETVARDHNHEVLKCYEDRLKANAKVRGGLTLSLDLSATGDVTAVRIAKSVDAKLDQCVADKARTWKFPWIKQATEDIEDAYHLHLNKEGQPASEYEGPSDPRSGVRSVVREHLAEIRLCYEGRLKSKPDLNGKLVVDWKLDEKGNVASIQAKQPLDETVDNCIMNQIKTWKFPVPAKNKIVSVTYPFFFAPR